MERVGSHSLIKPLLPSASLIIIIMNIRIDSGWCLFVVVYLQVLADAVSRLVLEKFSELTDRFASPHARRKVLAGVVMTTGTHRPESVSELA